METGTNEDKRIYELALLLPTEEDLALAVAALRAHHGEPVTEPRAKKLALAYEIKGATEGVFAYFNFEAVPADAKELERALVLDPHVLRSMIIAAPPEAEQVPLAASYPSPRRAAAGRPAAPREPVREPRPAPRESLSNEALEKKIEEILG